MHLLLLLCSTRWEAHVFDIQLLRSRAEGKDELAEGGGTHRQIRDCPVCGFKAWRQTLYADEQRHRSRV